MYNRYMTYLEPETILKLLQHKLPEKIAELRETNPELATALENVLNNLSVSDIEVKN